MSILSMEWKKVFTNKWSTFKYLLKLDWGEEFIKLLCTYFLIPLYSYIYYMYIYENKIMFTLRLKLTIEEFYKFEMCFYQKMINKKISLLISVRRMCCQITYNRQKFWELLQNCMLFTYYWRLVFLVNIVLFIN